MNQEENKTAEKKKLIIIAAVALMILVGVTTTYAYIGLLGESKNQEISIDTGNIHLIFDDADSANINAKLDLGDSITKKFKIENKGTKPVDVQINWKNLTNTYMKESLSYTLETSASANGPYTKIDTLVKNVPRSTESVELPLSKSITIPVQSAPIYYRVTITFNFLSDVNQNADINAKLITQFSLSEAGRSADVTLASLGLKSKSGTPDFMTVATTDETADGLYSMEDDYGTSYYFRGAVENNYVRFADYYWRIIRINGDGSLRMIYDGTTAHANGDNSSDRVLDYIAYNDKDLNIEGYDGETARGYDIDNGGVGYMYGNYEIPGNCNMLSGGCESGGSTSYAQAHENKNDSTIKEYVDSWYKTNIADRGYADAVSDTLFCNDRAVELDVHKQFYPQFGFTYPGDDKIAVGSTMTVYKNYFYINASLTGGVYPDIKCSQKNDRFTTKDKTIGNGVLKYSVGLITSNEYVLAGGKVGAENENFYLNKNQLYWTMSPALYVTYPAIVTIDTEGKAASFNENPWPTVYEAYVAPVINLSPEYAMQLTGTGSMSDPYTVS